ncbi:MAG: hypothetical protein IT458_08420 [Planctomycetes bacterium]|nr:hypothetical protein [Planctomycetota bacterium]
MTDVKHSATQAMRSLVDYVEQLERENRRLVDQDQLLQDVLRGTRLELQRTQEELEELKARKLPELRLKGGVA